MSKPYNEQALDEALEKIAKLNDGSYLSVEAQEIVLGCLEERHRNALCIPGGPDVEAAVFLILRKLTGKSSGTWNVKEKEDEYSANDRGADMDTGTDEADYGCCSSRRNAG